jgi:hypothetical protein
MLEACGIAGHGHLRAWPPDWCRNREGRWEPCPAQVDNGITDPLIYPVSQRALCDYLQHKTREDKYLREEYIAIQALVRYKGDPGDASIELGNERKSWDTRIARTDLFEVVQALAAEEHVIRRAIASGKGEVKIPIEDPGAGEPPVHVVTGPLAHLIDPGPPC